jgi:hypothetical protein
LNEAFLASVCRENQALSNGTSIAPGDCGIAEKKPKQSDRPESVIFQWSDIDIINDFTPVIQRKGC